MEAIEGALERYSQLTAALQRLQRAFEANPDNDDFTKLGIVTRGMARAEARRKAAEKFDQMQVRLGHFAILDLCAAFEAEFVRRMGTAIGEARTAVRKNYKLPVFSQVKERLVRERSSFNTLDSMFMLLEGQVSIETYERLTALRKQRNHSAHGVGLDQPPAISPADARDLLNEAAAELW